MIEIESLKDHLCLPYKELEAKNTEMRVDRESGKNSEYFSDKIQSYLREEKRIKSVTVCFTDIEGRFMMLDYNPVFLLESYQNLTFDGSSIKGFSSQNQSDLRLFN